MARNKIIMIGIERSVFWEIEDILAPEVASGKATKTFNPENGVKTYTRTSDGEVLLRDDGKYYYARKSFLDQLGY